MEYERFKVCFKDDKRKVYRTFDGKTFEDCDIRSGMKKKFMMKGNYKHTDEGLREYYHNFWQWCKEINKEIKLYGRQFDYYSMKYENCIPVEVLKEYGNIPDSKKVESVDAEEYFIQQSCYNAGLIYGKKQDKTAKEYHGYDFDQFFPNMLANLYGTELYIPLKRGKLRKMNKPIFDEEGKQILKIKYGYYKVKICSNEKHICKLFAFSKYDWYCSISINHALELKRNGYDIKFGIVEKAYLYKKKHMISTGDIFKDWNETIRQLRWKYPDNKLLKYIHSSIHGQLSYTEKKEVHMFGEDADEQIKQLTKDGYLWHSETSDSNIYVKPEGKQGFEFGQRIMPWLNAMARYKMHKIIKQLPLKNVKRIYIDSVILTEAIPYGKLKYMYSLNRDPKISGMLKLYGKRKPIQVEPDKNWRERRNEKASESIVKKRII